MAVAKAVDLLLVRETEKLSEGLTVAEKTSEGSTVGSTVVERGTVVVEGK